jgi:hypothetical protein
MGERPPDKMSLDRIDSAKDYGPDNCRWATSQEQNRNRSNNITINGEYLLDIAPRLGLKYQTAYWRLNHGLLTIDGKIAVRDR